ncbi:hypothetical protein CTAM01_12523 [Colletotrichum tamarilloi]|uniref:Uncharacterized protein n=1 Tax=Colletotrichum tamarilloi TaxID=1209934 RepID=A0ABQ9QUE5_9PEZI|nr:uncharacterized protein CTAM01_12523 [Colletotrichum tamarilloi]KAK1485455.1 hypothetical protein CTAM01_12523 [Colletotrichum tamarilloi]
MTDLGNGRTHRHPPCDPGPSFVGAVISPSHRPTLIINHHQRQHHSDLTILRLAWRELVPRQAFDLIDVIEAIDVNSDSPRNFLVHQYQHLHPSPPHNLTPTDQKMPSVINGNLSRRPYTVLESATRISHILHHPSLLTPREVVLGIYLVYITYCTVLTLRSIGYLVFEAGGRDMWCPEDPPVPEWYPPGWKVELSRWDCFRMLRWMVLRRFGALGYGVFAWGVMGVLGALLAEEGVRWVRR